ncbi:MAG: putative metal-binding motif-containing protein [Deltaproteobacteria bacterium]|nr:putative metal-binding motif-containing protein [Deltaproteobacteria bacterium]
MSIRHGWWTVACAAVVWGTGCSDDDTTSDADVPDETSDEGEAGRECTTDEDCWDDLFCNGAERCEGGFCIPGIDPCDDGLDCTSDVCNEHSAPRCSHEPDDSACRNDVVCDGVERCLLDRGCAPGVPLDCDDANPCTLDRCEESEAGCVHEPRDFDGDTHLTSGFGCGAFGGDDCDDGDAEVHPGALEICDDWRDNDCNGWIDMADAACRPENDTCEGATELTDGVPVSSTLMGLAADYLLFMDCGGLLMPDGPDAVFRFTLTEPRNVVLEVAAVPGWGDLGIVLQSLCGGPAADFGCNVGMEAARVRRFSLPAGTYYAIVKSMGEPEFTIALTTEDPTPPPANNDCAHAATLTPDVTVGGTTFGMTAEYTLACGWGSPTGPDVAYRFTLAEAQDVTIEVTSFPMGMSEVWVDLQAACGYASSSLACTQAMEPPATVRRLNLAAGTYYVVVSTAMELEFDITLRTTAPTPAPPNDACAGAVLLDPAAAPVSVDLLPAHDDYVPSCASGSPTPDVFYRLVLTEPHSLTAVPSGMDARVALMTACGDATTEFLCGGSSVSRDYLAAGTYYLVLEGTGWTTLDVSLGAPLTPPAFDTCAGALDVSAGGLFTADMARSYHDYPISCAGSARPDVVLTFTLTESRDVAVLLEPLAGTSTHALSLRTACADASSELRCRSGVSISLTQRSLPAGTYYLVVSGSATSPDNRFMLDVRFTAPTPIPPGDDCSNALDLSAGGSFAVTTVGMADDYAPTCGTTGHPDAVGTLTLTEPRDVTLSLTTGGVRSCIDLRSGACGTGATSILCASGTAPSLTARSLPAGTYWVLVDSDLETTGTLSVTLGPPTTACDGALAVEVDYSASSTFTWTYSGTTVGRPSEFTPVSCVSGTGPDLPFRLVVPSRSAVSIRSDTVDFDGALYLRSVCDVPSSQLDCDDDCGSTRTSCLPSDGSGTMTLEAGTYYVIQDAYSTGSGAFTLGVTATRL